MSTTSYRNNHSSKNFKQHYITTSSNSIHQSTTANEHFVPKMTNDGTRFPSKNSTNSVQSSLIENSLSVSLNSSKKILTSPKPTGNESSTNRNVKQTYTFSNPPREIQRQSIQTMKYLRNNRLRQRVLSAPDENSFQNSPRSIINQQKPLSANESSTPRSRNETPPESVSTINRFLKKDDKQKQSFNVLMKEQERSKVPKSVQRRRIILLFRRLPGSTPPLVSPRQQTNVSPIGTDLSLIENESIYQPSQTIVHDENPKPSNRSSRNSIKQKFDLKISSCSFKVSPVLDTSKNNPFHCIEQAELADSKQIAAILANIQSSDDWIPFTANGEPSPRRDKKTFDPTKYEYVTKSSLDTATFRLSPRTLKPDEELAAKSRFSQHYRYEMLSSVNAQVPPLMASIVAENNNNLGLPTNNETTFMFRLNSTSNVKTQNSFDEVEPIPPNIDGEEVQLCFDEILKCFYDPNTGTYYELTST